ncbi:hypothetical protein KDA_13470 [Dictyobacter alpinus]|uniref:Putative zinc-finger domain-containing protein n=1 Tax=Dictyobacter alpinus TaxID=2014873 RepID=A0A402B3E5_9CHLR|nr:zf-HC2 domain-containing protein [Dictyobacter alpinus]GCE25863.1 hypothetical protein KDA_13470 [Dictyobacter alpinus]
MHCAKATHQLQLYLDKQLTLAQTRALETHLSTCRSCCREYFLLEEIEQSLQHMEMVAEPANLTVNIMQKVAISSQQVRTQKREVHPLRLSLSEMIVAIILATITMFVIILNQPATRAGLPIGNGHDPISLFLFSIWNTLVTTNLNTLMACLWVFGTLLGVWITLAVAGSDMRDQWYRAVVDRLPVW